MRPLSLFLVAIMTNGCSLTQVISESGLRETTIDKIVAPRKVKEGEPIKVTLTVLEPSSCDKFNLIKVEKTDGNKLYVFRAFNSDLARELDHCALVANYANTEYIISDAPAGEIIIANKEHSIKVIVNVERQD